MDPIALIKENPQKAEILVIKWQEFVEEYPEAAYFETEEEFRTWTKKHPEITPETIRGILDGKNIQDSYNLLRNEDVRDQEKTQGSVDRSIARADISHAYRLEAFYSQQPKIIEEDRDYQKIEKQLEDRWLEQSPSNNLTSENWIRYRYGSLGDEGIPTLKKDAEKIFRERYPKRAKKDDEENRRVYKNPKDDPRVKYLKKEVAEHTMARKDHLGAPADIGQTIQNMSLQRFIKEYPEKARVYTQKGGNIVAPPEVGEKKEERKKTVPESTRDIYRILKKSEDVARVRGATGRATQRIVLGAGRTTGRLASQAGSTAGRAAGQLAARLATQAGLSVLRGTAMAAANPYVLAAIGIIIAIILIVFLIVMLVGGGGGGGLGGSPPQLECLDADGNRILVLDGNACATSLAGYYSNQTGTAITARCFDKCTDFIRTTCDRSPSTNTCDPPPASCGAPEAFCIEYTPSATGSGRLYDCSTGGPGYGGMPGFAVNSCGPTITPTP